MITIKVDTSALSRQLGALERQIPFATAACLNDLAFQAMRAENAAMSTVFAHPRPFTQHAAQVERKATKTSPIAIVSLRPAQERYLAPYEFGGLHALPGQALLEPVNARVDAYGQLPKGTVQKLAAMPNVFVATIHGITGFWQRSGRGTRRDGSYGTKGAIRDVGGFRTTLKLLLRFGVNKPVTKHLDFEKRAMDLVHDRGAKAAADAIAKAFRTAWR